MINMCCANKYTCILTNCVRTFVYVCVIVVTGVDFSLIMNTLITIEQKGVVIKNFNACLLLGAHTQTHTGLIYSANAFVSCVGI